MSSTERIRSASESRVESFIQLGSEINFSALAITSPRISSPVFFTSRDKEERSVIDFGVPDTIGSEGRFLSVGGLSLATPERC